MLTPIQVTLLVFVAMGVWNDYLLSSLFLNTQDMRTPAHDDPRVLRAVLQRLLAYDGRSDHEAFCPCWPSQPDGQKQILEGVVQGSVKG